MTQDQDPKLVELPTRLSQSKIWQIQRNYFASMGISAWKEEVPFYISSNAFIGHRYASLVLHFVKDSLHNNPSLINDVFYILEVGSGPGKFSYYFLKSFNKLLAENNLSHIQFCYVISDVIEQNVTFCQENTSFDEYKAKGQVDFCTFDVENDSDLNLRLKGTSFRSLQVKTPLVVIANYTFDCIKSDEVEVQDNEFYEIKLGLKSRYKDFNIEKSLHLDDLRLHFEREKINDINTYYDNPKISKIIEDYLAYFKGEKSRIVVPVGTFSFCDNLSNMTQNKAFVIVGDKGLTQPDKFSLYDEKFRYTYDGCYSFLVNFHAVGEYIKADGGDYLLTNNSNEFKVSLYSLGSTFKALTQTYTYYKESIECIGPEEYVYFYDEFLTCSFRFNFKSLLAFLRLSQWDPNAYTIVHDRIRELLPAVSALLVEDLKDDLNKVINNVYNINIGDDAYNLTGMIYQLLGDDDMAIHLYNQSLAVFGERGDPHSNLGLLYERQKNYAKAITHFERAVALDKHNRFAANKLNILTGRPYLAAIRPILRGLFVFGVIAAAFYVISR